MTLDFQNMMERVVALEKEALLALATPVTADAVDFFIYVQGTMPYFVNRLGDITVDGDSEDFDLVTVEVIMRLVIGHVSEGYEGEVDNRVQLYIPQVIQYLNERELLQSATYLTAMTDLVRARVISCTGLTFFRHTGATDYDQVGTEFTLRAEFEHMIEQQYL